MRSLARSRTLWVFVAFGAIAAFFLVTEHRAHFFGVLPFLFVLACPFLHLFHHRGHGRHEAHRNHRQEPEGGAP